MRLGFRTARLALGLDVGSYSLKAVKLERKSSGLKALKVAYARLSLPGPLGETEILPLLKKLLERSGLMKEPVSLILPGREASVRFFSLPKMPREEFSQAVGWELAKHASLPLEELVTDFVAYEATPGLAEGQLQVVAVMAPRTVVESWVEKLSRIGLRLAAIDIPALALLAYTDLRAPWESPGCIAVLDLGHTRTGIHFFQDRRLCFTREIAIGGGDVTQTIGDVLHVDAGQAEDLKQRLGVAGDGPEGEKVRQVVEQVLERIAVEVQRSFDYYQAQYREASFAAVRLCGGGALLPGLARYFSEALRLESSVEQPWQAVALDPQAGREQSVLDLGPVFSAGIGGATRRGGK